MWPPPTVWNNTHPQVHVHSLRLSPARLCSVGKISVWLISVQFSQKKPKRWNFDFSIPVWIFEVTFSVKNVYFPQTSIFFQISLKQLNFQLLHSSLPWEKRKIPNQTAPCHPDREINFSVFFQFNFRTKSYSVFSETLTIHFPDFRFFPLNRSPQPEFNHPNFSV